MSMDPTKPLLVNALPVRGRAWTTALVSVQQASSG
jgi:hypothetical protein